MLIAISNTLHVLYIEPTYMDKYPYEKSIRQYKVGAVLTTALLHRSDDARFDLFCIEVLNVDISA